MIPAPIMLKLMPHLKPIVGSATVSSGSNHFRVEYQPVKSRVFRIRLQLLLTEERLTK